MSTPVLLSPVENLAVGALGGALEVSLLMPLITLKFTTQEGRPLPKSVGGWYRGVVAQTSSVAPITAVQVMANGVFERLLMGATPRILSDREQIAAAMGAGAISAVVYSPADLVTIQQQKRFAGPVATIRQLVAEGGVRTLFRGFSACVVREAIYTGGYLGASPVVTRRLAQLRPDLIKEGEVLGSVLGSCIGGTLAALMTHPVDTAKTVIQGDVHGAKYKNAMTAMVEIYKEGGIQSLYKGGMARTTRLCGAFFVVGMLRDKVTNSKRTSLEAGPLHPQS